MTSTMNHIREDAWGLTEGDELAAGLTALRWLGGGAAYDGYLAFDEDTYGPVVVKLVRPQQVDSESTLRGLRREIDALERVRHPAVVRSLRHDLDGPRPHVVLEHLDGPRLSTLVRRYGPLQPQQYLPLAIEVASALHHFRRLGLVHLDVKPSNIIMGAPARLIDLSVMRTVEDAAALRYPIGTDAYMAPEQCDPPSTGIPGVASDVWGLGATLHEAVTGEKPFPEGDPDADDVADRFPQLVTAPAPVRVDAPGEVVELIDACLSPDPEARPLPHEIVDRLEPVLVALPRGHLAGFRLKG